ncbi:MAG TPA: glutamine amidotransferase [Myxococcota bacterium]|nr:glutamine amidotransferase [Myxococcota bacterium]HRY96847.1 glutamine amidotransferase [Myxococcota bacterium]
MTDTVLVFEGAAAWRLLLGALVLAVALALAWRGLRGGGRRRVGLWALRAVGLALLGALWLEPALQERLLRSQPRRVALLVDASASMALPAGERSRAELVRGFLEAQRGALAALAPAYALETYSFDSRLRPESLDALGRRADGPRTDLLAALEGLAGPPAGPEDGDEPPELAGVILLSDGGDTERLAEVQAGGPWPPGVEELLGRFPAPVSTFCACPEGALRDLAIADVRYDELAFVRNAVELEVTLEAAGLARTQVPVVLEQGGRLLASRPVELEPGRSARVALKFVPDQVGKAVYRVSVPAQPGERVLDNNSRAFTVRVVRDKIRVLHLVGRPSWDERFLRQLLRRDPNVDLVSFFILRTTSDSPGVSQDELSLIPFPVGELFGTELGTFDAVIFQNFNHGPYQVSFFLSHLRRYVEEGGGFLMLGGDLSFGSGRYGGTDLEEVLPVKLSAGDDLVVEEFHPLPAPAASGHPVLQLGAGEAGAAATWAALPPLGSYNRARALQPGARSLLVHPFAGEGGLAAPVLAIREVGRGRSAALLTDGVWRWNFWQAGLGGSPRAYHRLMNNLLRWLIRDPDLEAAELRAERSRYSPDEPVRLELRHPGTAGQARLELQDATTGQPLERRALVLDEAGRASVLLERLAPGAYQARLVIEDGGAPVALAEESFVVEGAGREARQPLPRPELLARLAEATGGRAGRLPEDGLSLAPLDPRLRHRVEASVTRPLLGRAWLVCGLVLLLAAEWWLRRRWGFP